MYSWPLASFKQIPNDLSCVYIMFHEATGREYVGRSVNLRDRARKHWQEIMTGTHKNPKIVNEFKRHGDGFHIRPVIIGSHDYCEMIEGKMLASLNLRNSLNCHRNSKGGWLGQEWTNESRKKLSEARKGKRLNPEAQRRAIKTRLENPAWIAHAQRMKHPDFIAKATKAASTPEARAKAVATRRANHGSDVFAASRIRQIEEARKRLFACLDWAIANQETRGAAIQKFNCSWGSLKKFQPEWEAINGPLNLPLRASGNRNGNSKAKRK